MDTERFNEITKLLAEKAREAGYGHLFDGQDQIHIIRTMPANVTRDCRKAAEISEPEFAAWMMMSEEPKRAGEEK